MSYRTKFITLLALCIIATPLSLSAHGGGQSVTQESGAYLLKLEAASFEVQAGSAERINFEIESKGGATSTPFTHVWVRIMSPKEELLFVGNIRTGDFGFVTGMSYFFPDKGEYKITARFFDGERKITETEFPLTVVADSESSALGKGWQVSALLLVIGFMLGKSLPRWHHKP